MSAGGAVLALLGAGAGGQRGVSVTDGELLDVARGVAAGLGAPFEVVWAGALGREDLETLGARGVERVHHLAGADSSAELAGAVEALFASAAPRALLATTSFASRELAGRLGVRTGAGVLVDAMRLEVVDGRLVAERTAFAASWGSRCEVLASPAIVTVKPHASVVGVEPGPPSAVVGPVPEVVPLAPGVADARVRVVSREPGAASGRPDLATAAVVVVGGRGTEGDFSLVEELADALGGAVGATRVATDEGWVGHELQVGQTGVTVNPVLYVGLGVAGAIHHVGGMRAAQTVVAVNTEPDAPLMEIADYAIEGDLFDVVPRLLARLRELRG